VTEHAATSRTPADAPPVDWDALQVGDPRPPYDGLPCMAWSALSPTLPYLCSRGAGHGGRQHVAVAGRAGAVAVWPVDGVK
jgi:hypothetical protein